MGKDGRIVASPRRPSGQSDQRDAPAWAARAPSARRQPGASGHRPGAPRSTDVRPARWPQNAPLGPGVRAVDGGAAAPKPEQDPRSGQEPMPPAPGPQPAAAITDPRPAAAITDPRPAAAITDPRPAPSDLAVPPWRTVLATTVRLWMQRHRPDRARHRPGGAQRRRGTAVLVLVAVAAVVIAGAVLFGAARTGHGGGRGATRAPARSAINAAAVSREQAARWIVSQVSKSAIVSCDPMMCSVLHARGFPAGNLMPLGPGSGSPLGSAIVVATAAVRNQFGRRLASVYAPGLVAAFGSGAARIDIRYVPAYGAAAYPAEMRTDLLARQQAGRALLRNRRLRLTAAAREQLAAGQVDSRVLVTLAGLTAQHRVVDVLGFGDSGPGASPGMPLRSAELAVIGTGSSGQRYLRSVLEFLRQQRPPYNAVSIKAHNTADRSAMTFEFSAPIVFNLLPKATS
jgi:hypothetical protein